MTLLEEEICNCLHTGGSKEPNKEGFSTHGKLQNGCGLIRRSVVFECGMCEELSASKKIHSVRKDIHHVYYCDECQKDYNLPPVECGLKRCHNWPN